MRFKQVWNKYFSFCSVLSLSLLGFNMGNDLAIFVTWGAFFVDGNQLTNLMSIGRKSTATGVDPPAPAIVSGLNTHGIFEGLNQATFVDLYTYILSKGDASTTRGDFYFGDNFSFNETLFDQVNPIHFIFLQNFSIYRTFRSLLPLAIPTGVEITVRQRQLRYDGTVYKTPWRAIHPLILQHPAISLYTLSQLSPIASLWMAMILPRHLISPSLVGFSKPTSSLRTSTGGMALSV